jgi:hypothetical protein
MKLEISQIIHQCQLINVESTIDFSFQGRQNADSTMVYIKMHIKS